jgi:hypothetical protein
MNCNDFHPKMRRSSCIPNGISQWNGARTDMASYLTGVRTRPQSQLVLANFDPHNDERKRVWDQVCNGTLAAHTSCIYSPSLHADEVFSIISSHTFLLSPRGVGLDCYRTYEALLLGSYPIVKSSALDGVFDGLPVLIVEDWDDLTIEVLQEFERVWRDKTWDNSMLFTGYWWNLFTSFSNIDI